ncbi:cysteine desulfurase [Patescibacteria group bacterium]|nr:cysteine desulfurase [Patescibacteria group bacterium]
MNIINIKNEFPVLKKKINGKKLIYFDNACTALKPKSVIKAVNDYYQNLGVCGGNRSSHYLSWQVQELVEKTKENVRQFINASLSDDIIWTKNTTEGINLIAASLPISKEKNEIVLTTLEHHSNLLPYYEQSKKRGLKIKILSPNKDGTLDLDKLNKIITKKTALVAITHLSNVTGLVYPVKKIADLTHSKGAKILVDDAQYVASHKEDVQENKIDYLVFSGHKLGAPTGIGVLYVREGHLKNFSPFNVGGGTVQSVKIKGNNIYVKYLPSSSGFEAGIQHYAGIAGLNSAINFLSDIGYQKITRKIESLTHYAQQQLRNISEVKFLIDYKQQKPSSLIAFYLKSKKLSLYDFNLYLNYELKDHAIAVRCGHHCAQPLHDFFGSPISMRLSFFIYNTEEEVDIFIKAFKKFLKND